jgi:hypothetical protein
MRHLEAQLSGFFPRQKLDFWLPIELPEIPNSVAGKSRRDGMFIEDRPSKMVQAPAGRHGNLERHFFPEIHAAPLGLREDNF